ncbi:hypothetical protein [Noviherbaspirillum autotrophicum]|uniref:Uncharacterized protein n=1 Tax=Noviherbaspirillum autotrophicum TaxID=709839 RepID=A0A0C2BNR0_9BURK|nr:hypothetical protein [Noviherbaspirillum autotrophicum]KIF81689.1 hypothetical protein TSA66_14265 [Noviherbaspirillum autotrophicum]KIF82056.1 hypothetical protein TSA66_16630 [Noviherbaspirillum autotrophicum]KIF84150.1 hypothetical protein TSA66_00390 [Noviherbaspirillum autotrophicum]
MDFPDKSVRFASSRAEFNQDDILYILVPDNAKVDTNNGDATLNRIVDIHVLESPQFRERAPQSLISGAMVALQDGKQGYAWRAFQARHGKTTLTVDIDGKKIALNVEVQPYIAPAPEPVKVPLEKATRESPFGMRAGQEFEFTLPGELAAGWSVDGLKGNGVTLKSLTQLQPAIGSAEPAQPRVRLVFDASGSNYSSVPQRLSIRRGGAFVGETFELYLVFYPIPTC